MAAEGVFVSLNECTTLLVKHLPNGGSEMERKAGREGGREREWDGYWAIISCFLSLSSFFPHRRSVPFPILNLASTRKLWGERERGKKGESVRTTVGRRRR
jgi:hypothetical protein